MFISTIIAAGGRGQRLGREGVKQLLSIGGRPILERSVSVFLEHPAIQEVVVALPSELAGDPPIYLRSAMKPVRIVTGGERRRDSVARAFESVAEEADIVLVHDAARPFVTARLIDLTIAATVESGAALAALPARDTVKLAGGSGTRFVQETLPRDAIFLAQTPQAFQRNILKAALASNRDATDEAALAERAGYPVRLVEGEASNIKITVPDDLLLAEAIARARDGQETLVQHVGIGYDLHTLVAGRPLILGGVTIPFERGLLGHSDADAVCHAVTDAVLGAVGAGDIGSHFPDTAPEWAGASSLDLLRRAAHVVRQCGCSVVNVDVIVIAERPKLRPYVDPMRANIADALGMTPDRVSVKGKTNEGVGDLGRGEAIAVHAVAMILRRETGQVRSCV
jgi:2-C-methyl-D-erythritol 4-phosphate cytidylyltransferase / 2-C-methyl-D-erythritol 2,4-cyclodiphosphate synthase